MIAVAIDTYEPTKKDLKDAIEPIYYEIKQLVKCARILMDDASPAGVIHDALLESRLLHLRNLLDFFEHKKRGTSRRRELPDVLAADYGFPPMTIELDSAYRVRLNQDLAHLSYKRGERSHPSQRKWPLAETVLPVLGPCRAFIQHILPDTRWQLDEAKVAGLKALLVDIDALEQQIKSIRTLKVLPHPAATSTAGLHSLEWPD